MSGRGRVDRQAGMTTKPSAAALLLLLLTGPALFAACTTEPAEPVLVAGFDPGANEFPDGVALRDGHAYVGIATTSEIVRVPLDGSGRPSPFARLPRLAPGAGFMLGLAAAPSGEVFAALASFDPAIPAGVYRIAPDGGNAVLFARHPDLTLPNGLAFDPAGRLYVTDPIAGGVFAIDAAGTVTPWTLGGPLAGDSRFCGEPRLPFPAGANGIAYHGGALHVSNTDRATVVRMPIQGDGTAGAAETIAAPDCAQLAGADGLAVDADGNVLVAINFLDRIVRIAPGRAPRELVTGELVQEPGSITWDPATNAIYWTNFPILRAGMGRPAQPGLVRIPLEP